MRVDSLRARLLTWTKAHRGYLETKGNNRGPIPDKWNRMWGVPVGSAFCATGASTLLKETKTTYPPQRSGWAKAFLKADGVSAADVYYGRAAIPLPCLAVFTRTGGGHVEVHLDTMRIDGKLQLRGWSANTSRDGNFGSQWNGDWTGEKMRDVKRWCSPFNSFRIVEFVKIAG